MTHSCKIFRKQLVIFHHHIIKYEQCFLIRHRHIWKSMVKFNASQLRYFIINRLIHHVGEKNFVEQTSVMLDKLFNKNSFATSSLSAHYHSEWMTNLSNIFHLLKEVVIIFMPRAAAAAPTSLFLTLRSTQCQEQL